VRTEALAALTDTITAMPEAADASLGSSEAVSPELSASAGQADEAALQRLYGEQYFLRDYTVPYGRSEHWLDFFGQIGDRIVTDLAPESSLDAGCAMGLLVEQLAIRGVDAFGVDISEFAIGNAPEGVRDRLWLGTLTDKLPRRYDLITCIEVIEHLAPAEGREALANLCGATDRILFSSVPDGYEEPTHVNVQPPEAWSAWFAEHGFVRAVEYDASYLSPWAVLYERRGMHLAEIVRDYDRAHWRLRNEVQQLRQSVMRLAQQSESEHGEATTQAVLEARIAGLREQLLIMRDTVVGLEASLGEARGEREFYAAHAASREAAVKQLEELLSSRSWRLTWKLGGPWRRFKRALG
jgi:hypothetical protein